MAGDVEEEFKMERRQVGWTKFGHRNLLRLVLRRRYVHLARRYRTKYIPGETIIVLGCLESASWSIYTLRALSEYDSTVTEPTRITGPDAASCNLSCATSVMARVRVPV